MFYVLDENKNLVEAYDKQGFLAFLEQAIENGDLSGLDEDSAFVTKLKDPHTGVSHAVAFVTQAQYNALEQAGDLIVGAYYFITDDTTAEDLEALILAVQQIAEAANTTANANAADLVGIFNGSKPAKIANRVGDMNNAFNFEISDTTNFLTILRHSGADVNVWRMDRFSKIYNPLSATAIAAGDTITLTQLVKAGDRLRFEYYPFWNSTTGKQLKYTDATVTYLDDTNGSLGIYLTDTVGSTTNGVRFINAIFKVDETGLILTFSQDHYYNVGNSSHFSNASIHLSAIYKII